MHSRKVFKNGLTVLSEEMAHVRSVSFGILVKSGSRFETPGVEGISHFLEHMVFKGNKNLSAFQIAEGFDLLGASIDAFTAREYTCFYVKMVDDKLPEVMKLLSEMLLKPAFLDKEIYREKGVVLEEIKMYQDTPDEFTFDAFLKGIYGGHSLGKPILGYENTVNSFNQKNTGDYYRKYFAPQNIIMAAAGNIDHDEFCALIEKYFGGWKKSGFFPKFEAPGFAFKTEKLEKKLEQVHLCLGTEGLAFKHEDRYKLLVMNEILGGSMSSHLFQEVREKRGLCYAISSLTESHTDSGVFFVYAATDKEKLSELIEVIRAELDKIKLNITDKELERIKQQVKSGYIISMENSVNRMSRLIKQEYYDDKFLELDGIMEEIEKIKKEDLMEFAEKLFVEQRMKLLTVGPS
ncbi:MAG: pitrilysin family protein [Candidatus Firestonebacteria bacterium]